MEILELLGRLVLVLREIRVDEIDGEFGWVGVERHLNKISILRM